MKRVLVCGAGGFIGNHLVNRLKADGFWVRGVDLKHPEFQATRADDFLLVDLREQKHYDRIFAGGIEHVYQLAADMGGAGYIFTGLNDAAILHNSALINLNVVEQCRSHKVSRVFYSSSACVYPEHNQLDPDNPECSEGSAYPASPDSEYGWEKLFSERIYLAFKKNCGLDVKIARFHNIFGELGTWQGGKEKAPAAICRKVAEAHDGDTVEVWGDGKQTRSFLYIDECVEGVMRLCASKFGGPVNVGSEEMVTINGLVEMVAKIAGKRISIKNVPGPSGVRGRNSDNRLIEAELKWAPSAKLQTGLERTYEWIERQVLETKRKGMKQAS